jgi:serine/threonine protein kinase
MALESDAKLNHYRIVRPLGRGGMGEVYLAEDLKLERLVALKLLPPELAEDPRRRERFEREARIVAALDHPHIVTVHSIETDGDCHFITMQHVEGEELSARVRPGGLETGELLDIAVPLVDAVSAAHRAGVVHRDLKPSNVLVDASGRVRVLDFGVAKLTDPDAAPVSTQDPTAAQVVLTEDGATVGTAAYMSPEQVEGREVDARSDIFSLGILLYELASGRRPFQGESRLSLGAAILRDDPPPLLQVRADLPNHLGRIVDHALQKDVERRYQTALDLRNDLESLRSELDSAASVSTQAVAPASPARISPAIRWSALGAAVLVAFWLAFGPRLGRPSTNDEPVSTPGVPIEMAVLPFEFSGQEGDLEFLSDGLARRLISNLARLDELNVKAWSLVSRHRGEGDPTEVGEKLGVEAVLAASVTSASGRVRVAVELVDVDTGSHLWGEQYEHEVDDILEVQEALAAAIVDSLSLGLGEGDSTDLVAGTTTSAVAFQLYHKGLAFLEKSTPSTHAEGIELMRQAVQEDPGFALAWAGLSLGFT